MESRAFKQDMIVRLGRYFIISAGVVLVVTSAAKLISSGGGAKLLEMRDPIFGLHFRYLLLAAGIFEMIVALACFVGKNILFQAKLLVYLCSILCTYRIGIWLTGTKSACGCLGTLTSAIYMTPQTADVIMMIVLGYLLTGSVVLLFPDWRIGKEHRLMTTGDGVSGGNGL